MKTPALRTLALATALALTGLTHVACTTTTEASRPSPDSSRAAMNAAATETLSRLYVTVPGSQELVARAAGVLVFPHVVGGAFVVGADHGKGELRVNNQPVAYYSMTGGSIGLQAGGQSRAVIYVFNTPTALQNFRASNGWSADADAGVAIGKVGASGHIDTSTAQQAISTFTLTNVGLELGASVGGTKISPVNLP